MPKPARAFPTSLLSMPPQPLQADVEPSSAICSSSRALFLDSSSVSNAVTQQMAKMQCVYTVFKRTVLTDTANQYCRAIIIMCSGFLAHNVFV